MFYEVFGIKQPTSSIRKGWLLLQHVLATVVTQLGLTPFPPATRNDGTTLDATNPPLTDNVLSLIIILNGGTRNTRAVFVYNLSRNVFCSPMAYPTNTALQPTTLRVLL